MLSDQDHGEAELEFTNTYFVETVNSTSSFQSPDQSLDDLEMDLLDNHLPNTLILLVISRLDQSASTFDIRDLLSSHKTDSFFVEHKSAKFHRLPCVSCSQLSRT